MQRKWLASVVVLFCFVGRVLAQDEAAMQIEPKRASFDSTAPHALEVKRTTTGHLLVKVNLNGQDAGWWILDTGAGMSCIEKEFAEQMNLPDAGAITAKGMGGEKQTKLRTFDSLKLGGLHLEDGKLLELNLKPYGFLMGAGVQINGIVGHDCFMNGVFDIDLANAVVSVHDPKTFKLAPSQGQWTSVKTVGRTPAVEGTIEGSEPGMFTLDTGSNEGLLVHSRTVERLKLLENRKTGTGMFGGVGGAKAVKTGRLKSVTVGGCEMSDVSAAFAQAKDGASASDEVLATVGLKFLSNFRMVINQSTDQIAFSRTTKPSTQPTTKPSK